MAKKNQGPTTKLQGSPVVTVYPSGYAQVKQTIRLKAGKGLSEVTVGNLPDTVRPSTVRAKNFTGGAKRQSISYDRANLTRLELLKRLKNRKVTVIYGGELPSERAEVTGKLLSFDGSEAILDVDGAIQTIADVRDWKAKKLPKGLSNTAAVLLKVKKEEAGSIDGDLFFDADGFASRASYEWLWDPKAGTIRFTGDVSILNTSGATLDGAKVYIAAGDAGTDDREEEDFQQQQNARPMNRAMTAKRGGHESLEAASFSGGSADDAGTESLGPIQLFGPFEETLVNDRRVKVTFMDRDENQTTPVECAYRVNPAYDNWWARGNGGKTEHSVRTVLTFVNSKENKLGAPLLGGKVKVVRLNKAGDEVRAGGGSFGNVTINEKKEVQISSADFDLKVKRSFKTRADEPVWIEDEPTVKPPEEGKKAEPRTRKQSTTHYSDCELEFVNGKDFDVDFYLEEAIDGKTYTLTDEHEDLFTLRADGVSEKKLTVGAGSTQKLGFTLTWKTEESIALKD